MFRYIYVDIILRWPYYAIGTRLIYTYLEQQSATPDLVHVRFGLWTNSLAPSMFMCPSEPPSWRPGPGKLCLDVGWLVDAAWCCLILRHTLEEGWFRNMLSDHFKWNQQNSMKLMISHIFPIYFPLLHLHFLLKTHQRLLIQLVSTCSSNILVMSQGRFATSKK